MKEAAKSAERVRDELQTFRNRAIIIDGQEQCSICDVFLLVKPFFMFPCGHKFHTDCLETGIAEYLCKFFKIIIAMSKLNYFFFQFYSSSREKSSQRIKISIADDKYIINC